MIIGVTLPSETQEIVNSVIANLKDEELSHEIIVDKICAEYTVRGIQYNTFDWDNIESFVISAGLSI